MFNRERLTLSLDASAVRLLVARGQRILRWGSILLPDGVTRNGLVVQPTAFGEAVANLVKKARGPRRKAVISLSGQRSLVRILRLPPVPPRMLDETVRRAARRESAAPQGSPGSIRDRPPGARVRSARCHRRWSTRP